VARLEIGPAIFFMISGFLLYRTFCAATFAGRVPTRPRLFFRRRALRIAPYVIKRVGIVSTLLPGLAPKVVEKTLRVTAERLGPVPQLVFKTSTAS